ncbi:hypothetical protein LINPERHAP2_LOCUS36214 [Linum perenne]
MKSVLSAGDMAMRKGAGRPYGIPLSTLSQLRLVGLRTLFFKLPWKDRISLTTTVFG